MFMHNNKFKIVNTSSIGWILHV